MSEETTQLVVGDAAVEALTPSRSSRRRFGRRKPEKDAPAALTQCQNCEAPLTGAYCANCGQHAIDYRRSLMRVLSDAADSFLNWDTKFLASIGVLITRPWRLTNDFNTGRRARYVHPLRLYLLASIAFFLVAKMANLAPTTTADLKAENREELDADLAKSNGPDVRLNAEQRAKAESARQKEAGPDEPPSRKKKPISVTFNGGDKNAPKTPFQQWIETRIKEKVGEDGTKAGLFLDTLRSNLPTMMLFCIPLFAFVLKVLYLRQRRFYVEHLVYALHIHTFVYLAVVVTTLLALGAERYVAVFQPFVTGLFSLVTFSLVFLSIRRVYRQGWFLTTAKFLVGGFVYVVILAFAVGTTAFVTLLLP